MKDFVKSIELPKIEVPKIYGKVEIVTKTKHGLVEKVKGENTFQASVLAKVLDKKGEFNLPTWWDYANLVGGLFLFDKAIPSNSRFMPAGTKMLGHGYRGCVTQGTYPLLGTYNASESAASASGIVQTYDFATNQANGNIKSVCLTSKMGGQIGYGIGNNDPYAYLEFQDILGAGIGMEGAQSGFYNGYRYYVSDYSNGKISIQKTPIDVEKGNIFRGFSKTLEFTVSEIGTPKDVNPYWNIMGDCGSGKFRFWSEQVGGTPASVGSGGTIYYYEFDAANETLTQETFNNTSGETIRLCNYGVQFIGKYCFVSQFNYGTVSTDYLIFDVDNNTFVKKLTGYADFAIYNGSSSTYYLPSEISDDLFLLAKMSGNNVYTVFYDIVADEVQKANLQANNYSSQEYGRPTQMRSLDNVLKFQIRDRNYVCQNPLYLATIFNVPNNGVIKDATITMKVTYTLSEA